ncbi:MAG: cation:proton antiporter, partial [Acidimicrobiales bacterium]
MVTSVDAVSFLVIVSTSAVAALIVSVVAPKLTVPVVVVELLLGIVIGPQGTGLAEVDDFTEFLGNLGLGMLFYFAGYEIDFERIRGRPLKLAAMGWGLSLALAYGLGAALAVVGVVVSLVYTGSALATTAIGTLIPILRDSGDLKTRFGTYLLGAGAVGEFGPILLITILLSATNPLNQALLLIAFIGLAVLCGVLAVRSVGRGWAALERTLESSSQLIVRLVVVLVVALLALANDLGLDLLLGGFVAGMISRLALRGHEIELFESKITALGYGLLVPFFFVTSGMNFDLDSLIGSPTAMLKLPLFAGLF